jgi:transposase
VRRGHGPRVQPTLPLVEIVHTLEAPDRACTACGGALTEMAGQTEDSEEIDVVERSYRLVRHRRQKYRCRCGGCVETALGPPKLQPGGRYSIDFAVSVAVAKYLDHLPLARQARQMARAGLTVETQTLFDQLFALQWHLLPSYEALHHRVLAAPVIGADETVWPLLDRGGGKRWYAWSITAPDAVFHRIDPSRSAEAAAAILRDYTGVVVSDGYGAYGKLAREGPHRFTLAHCWAHVRRKLVECEPAFPQAAEALDLLGQLYAVEADAKRAPVDDPRAHLAEQRRVRAAPLVAAIRAWMQAQRVLPQSGLGRAIAYADGLWPGLVRFLDDPAIPLDNNATERALRGVVVGRKNHYGSKSQRGTEVAALFYSLLESAKLAGVDPAAYLAEATRRAIANPGTVTLPSDLAAT